jgi:diacylglycerol O-acyltransferase
MRDFRPHAREREPGRCRKEAAAVSYNHYDRLSALDAAFLGIEDGNAHMHIGAVAIFDAGPLAAPGGGIDFERIVAGVGAAIQQKDRFKQKLKTIPGANWPVWIDDARFNLRYHVRHTSLPAPGNERLLKRLAGRIMSEELDRAKPLWELWFVEGVEGGSFAVISKIHHAMADGVAGADLLSVLMNADPDRAPKRSDGWEPRPAPTSQRLVIDELTRLARIPVSLLGVGWRALMRPREVISSVWDEAVSIGSTLEKALSPASETEFNQKIGPHRRFDWSRLDLAEISEVAKQLGGTLNDVVLTVISGVIRENFNARGLALRDLDFRVMVPVSVRGGDERGELGNRVSMLVVPLPLDEADPRRRHERVCAATREAKGSGQRAIGEALAEIADVTGSNVLTTLLRIGLQSRVANLVVTNVPGPPFAVYLFGAKLREVYPVVPLGLNQALGVALFSYDGALYWGFNADWDQLPDLHELVDLVDREFAELRTIAGRRSNVAAVS